MGTAGSSRRTEVVPGDVVRRTGTASSPQETLPKLSRSPGVRVDVDNLNKTKSYNSREP